MNNFIAVDRSQTCQLIIFRKHVCNQHRIALPPFECDYYRFLYIFDQVQLVFNFPKLNSVSAYLNLLINAAKTMNISIFEKSAKVTCPVHLRTFPAGKRIAYKLLFIEIVSIQVTSSNTVAANINFADCAN